MAAWRGMAPPSWYGGVPFIGISRGTQTGRKGGTHSGPSGKKAKKVHLKGRKIMSDVPSDLKKPRRKAYIVPRQDWNSFSWPNGFTYEQAIKGD